MRNDVKSNYALVAAMAAQTMTVGTANSTMVDHADAGSVSFLLSVGTVTGTVDVKSQYSDDGSAWTDYPVNDEARNDDAIVQLTAPGSAELHIPNPRARYSRVVVTVGGTSAVLSVASVLGPLRHVAA